MKFYYLISIFELKVKYVLSIVYGKNAVILLYFCPKTCILKKLNKESGLWH